MKAEYSVRTTDSRSSARPLPTGMSASLLAGRPSYAYTVSIEQLLPFGAAAKGIFVAANGLNAYYASLGESDWSDDGRE